MPEIGRELANKLQMTELSSRAFISQLLESITKRLVIRKNDKVTAFDHMSEELDVLIHCQELAIVRTLLLLSGAEFMGVQSQGVPSIVDTLLQGLANSGIRSVLNKANAADGSG